METKKFLDYAGLAQIIDQLYKRGFKGMGLSTNDFTSDLKAKLENIPENAVTAADLKALNDKVAAIEQLIESDANGAIDKFNEIVAFLEGIGDTDTLDGIVSGISAKITAAEGRVKTLEDRMPAGSGKLVAAEAGKGLSANDYTAADKAEVAKVAGLGADVASLKSAVGDTASGITKDVADLKGTVGGATSGLVKDTADLKTVVGSNASGLVKDVNDLRSAAADHVTTAAFNSAMAEKLGTGDIAAITEAEVTALITKA